MGVESSLKKIEQKLEETETLTEYLEGFQSYLKQDLINAFRKEKDNKKIYKLKGYKKPRRSEDLCYLLIIYYDILNKTFGKIEIDNAIWIKMLNHKKYILKEILKIEKVIVNNIYEQNNEFISYFYHHIQNEIPQKLYKDLKSGIKTYSYHHILKFMKIFGKKFQSKPDFLKSLCEIMRNITYNDIDSNLKIKTYFFGSEFQKIFGNTYEYFITCFLSNVKSGEDFWFYAEFFNLINHKQNRNIYEILGFYHLFCKIQKEIYEKDNNNFISIVLFLLDLFYLNHLDITKEFFIILGKNFNEQEYIDFLFYLNNNYINEVNNNLYLRYYIWNFFEQKFIEKNKDISYLIGILNHLNDIQEINRVFNHIFDVTINSEEFYNKSENENISKITKLFKTEYYQNPQYSENIEKINSIKNTLILLSNTLILENFTYRKLKEMNSLTNTELLERLYLLFIGENKKLNQFFFC